MWLERFLLVVPSKESGLKFVWVDLFISTGFLALFLLSQADLSRRLEEEVQSVGPAGPCANGQSGGQPVRKTGAAPFQGCSVFF